MLELFAGLQEGVLEEGAYLLQLSLLAVAAGFLAEWMIDTGVRSRGTPLLCGFVGVYFGAWVWQVADWNPGPILAGHGLVPALAGTLFIAVFLKLVSLGIAGPHR